MKIKQKNIYTLKLNELEVIAICMAVGNFNRRKIEGIIFQDESNGVHDGKFAGLHFNSIYETMEEIFNGLDILLVNKNKTK